MAVSPINIFYTHNIARNVYIIYYSARCESRQMAASEELCKYKLSPLPGATSEVWKYFGFEKKDGKLVDRREVSAK